MLDMLDDRSGPHEMPGMKTALAELMALRDGPAPDAGEVSIRGADPFYRTPFRVGEAVAATLAATGVAANDLWELRGGERQHVAVDVRHAAATLRTVDYSEARGEDGVYRHIPIPGAMSHMLKVTQPWPTRDGRWFLPHLNLPNLSARVLGVLGCDSTPEAVSAAVATWDADALEEAIAAARACGGTIRSPEEWLAHPQGRYLASRPLIEITRIGDSPAEPLPPAERPLAGIRVLDLTRVLAGPVAGRSLAEHGADVLMVTAPGLPQTPEHVRDTSHGKRSCFLNVTDPAQLATLKALAAEADVFVDGYRPGRLAEYGLGAEALAALRPGIVSVSVSCFGSGGPFALRAGWEQVAQAVSGVCQVNGALLGGPPKLVFAPLCDYTTGYLAAYGIMLALARRAREGGSWRVQVSLCQSAMFAQRQGLVEHFADAPERLTDAELAAHYVEEQGCYGAIRTLGPALEMSETPCRWARPTPRLGSDAPVWL